ncbi:hypothetical protein BKA61DRAFT_636641 [Leptodontidium sp. MPI-SDFR-AT-0119]|nr:hypothetical protein BKA61DRAFT_636641 [Leptodontidium sp. MPI-SDFR-AT-0119]
MANNYDFIVVRAGTAGAILAKRLATSLTQPKVALIEAGGKHEGTALRHIYDRFLTTFTHPELDYGYVTSLGARDEFDAWANAVDGPEWGFQSILSSIKKFENLTVELTDEWRKYVQLTAGAYGFLGYILDAGIEAGVSHPISIGLGPATNRQGIRTTSASAFLDQHSLPNLTIIVDLTGVQTGTVFASKEILLSAGAIDTPKLLLLSGVGPKTQLEALGIKVKADLPVGKNLIDHPCVPITYYMGPGFTSRLELQNDAEGFKQAIQELRNGRGPLMKHYSTTPTAFLKSDYLYRSEEFAALSKPSQGLLIQPSVPSFEFAIGGPLIPLDYRFNDPKDSYLNFFVTLMNSQSRGEVTLSSADPLEKPIINPQYLEHPYDCLVLNTAIRESLKWIQAPSLKKFVKWAILAPESDSNIDIEDDPATYVDHNLKVHGLNGLRVADLSVPLELLR